MLWALKRVSCLVFLVLLCACDRDAPQAPEAPSAEMQAGVHTHRPEPDVTPIPNLDLSLPESDTDPGDTSAWREGEEGRFSGLIATDGSARSEGRVSVRGKVYLREGEALDSQEAIDGGEVRIEMKTN